MLAARFIDSCKQILVLFCDYVLAIGLLIFADSTHVISGSLVAVSNDSVLELA